MNTIKPTHDEIMDDLVAEINDWEDAASVRSEVIELAALLIRVEDLVENANMGSYSDLDRQHLRDMLPPHRLTLLIYHLADLRRERDRQESQTLGWEVDRTISLFVP